MVEIAAFWVNGSGTPLTSPVSVPSIRIRRIDTQALVVTDANMTEIGDGWFGYTFDLDTDTQYVARCDGDPGAAGQVTPAQRYKFVAFSGLDEKARMQLTNRLDVNVAGSQATVFKDDGATQDHQFNLTTSPDTRTPV